MDVTALAEAVEDILRDAATRLIRPRFRALVAGDVSEKTPGELVTVADRDAERAITAALSGLTPGVPVVGEEAAAADPASVDVVAGAPYCWLVDPLDGTAGFVDGSPDYAVLVTLVRAGEPVGAWIWQPEHDAMWTASRGEGVRRNGVEARSAGSVHVGQMRLAVLSRFFDAGTRAAVARGAESFGEVTDGRRCAGVTYPLLVEGQLDAVLFWRTLPWDHAPGTLLVTESGGAAARPDGTAYRLGDDRRGLLVTARRDVWFDVRDALLGVGP